MTGHNTSDTESGTVDTVAGHEVVRPDTFSGVNVDHAKRTANDTQRNPLADVVGREPGTVYHVVPKHGDDVGVLVTIRRLMQGSSWEPTSVTGPARSKNTPTDVRVDAVISPLADHDTLPSDGTYDPDADPHGTAYDGSAAALLPDERLETAGLDSRAIERHELVPAQANWFRFTD